MATQTILKVILKVLSCPLVLLSSVFETLNVNKTNVDIAKCLQIIDRHSNTKFSKPLIHTLIIAEDRRNSLHCGIDPIAIVRAIWARLFKDSIQGASTIEQQFVRVALGRYEKTITRKIREQLLAISLCKRTDKEKIAATYLSIAFYGTKLVGLEGVSKLCNSPIENISYYDAIRIVSRLKYPEPSKNKERWNTRHEFRCEYLSKKLLTSAKGMVPDVAEKATPLIPSRAIKLDQ